MISSRSFFFYQSKIKFFTSNQCNGGFVRVGSVSNSREIFGNNVVSVMKGKILKTELTNDIKIYEAPFL